MDNPLSKLALDYWYKVLIGIAFDSLGLGLIVFGTYKYFG